MRPLLALALVVGLAGSARAQHDHLVPERGTLAPHAHEVPYHAALRDAFGLMGSGPSLSARMLVMPSLAPEWVVEVRREGGGHVVALGRSPRSIWGLLSEAGGGAFDPPPIDWVEAELPETTAARVRAAWAETIIRTRYPERDLDGLDGVSYHFAAWIGGRGVVSGSTWSPDPETIPGLLKSLGEALRDVTLGDAEAADLDRVARDLRSRLDATG